MRGSLPVWVKTSFTWCNVLNCTLYQCALLHHYFRTLRNVIVVIITCASLYPCGLQHHFNVVQCAELYPFQIILGPSVPQVYVAVGCGRGVQMRGCIPAAHRAAEAEWRRLCHQRPRRRCNQSHVIGGLDCPCPFRCAWIHLRDVYGGWLARCRETAWISVQIVYRHTIGGSVWRGPNRSKCFVLSLIQRIIHSIEVIIKRNRWS